MAASPPVAGTVGRYRLERLLGRGATAEVWRTTDTTTGRPACLKRLRPELASDPAARERLTTELAAARLIRHEGLVPIAEGQPDGPDPYICFAFVPGETLAAVLAQRGRLEPRQAAQLAARIAEVLAAVHKAGLVHRDVKPGNILLGDDGQARLLDFGISAPKGAAAQSHSGAGRGMTVGTLPYISPEQLAGEPVSPASDVFSLGAVLYQTLSGRPPFDAAEPAQLARAHTSPPRTIPGVPQELTAIALGTLRIRPDERPAAAELARQLHDWLSIESLYAAPTSVMPIAGQVASRRTTGLMVGGGLLAALALAVGWVWAVSSTGGPAQVAPRIQAEPRFHALQSDSLVTSVELRTADQPPPAMVTVADVESKAGSSADSAQPKAKTGKAKGKGEGDGKAKGAGKGNGKDGKNKGKGGGKGRG